jgi:hypothetical protein
MKYTKHVYKVKRKGKTERERVEDMFKKILEKLEG